MKNLFYILCLLIFASCSSSSKIKSSTNIKLDSTAVSKIDSNFLKKVDSTNLKVWQEDESDIVEVELEPSNSSAEDYTGIITPQMSLSSDSSKLRSRKGVTNRYTLYTYDIDGRQITTPHPAKKITVKTGKQSKQIDLTNIVKSDSGKLIKVDSTNLKKKVKAKGKEVSKMKVPFLIQIIAIIIVIFIILYLLRRWYKNIVSVVDEEIGRH